MNEYYYEITKNIEFSNVDNARLEMIERAKRRRNMRAMQYREEKNADRTLMEETE